MTPRAFSSCMFFTASSAYLMLPTRIRNLRFPRPIFGADHVLGIWQDEFRMIREWRGLYVLVMHPQVTGRPMRMAILRSFIAFTRQFDDVWYATGREIAEAFAKQEVR
jgi:hypothetical protein